MRCHFPILLFATLAALVPRGDAFASIFERIGDDIASPVTTPAKYVFWTVTVATLALVALEDEVVDPAQRNASSRKPLGRYTTIGDYGGKLVPNAAYAVGMLIAGAFGDENGFRRAEVMTFGSLYSVGVTSLLKIVVREPRPNYGGDRKSFPSGHTTAAFAFASVVGAEHGIYWAIPAYLLAGTTALSRMNDNKHYLHDVIAGATIGAAYGFGIYYLRKSGEGNVTFLPLVDGERFGLTARIHF